MAHSYVSFGNKSVHMHDAEIIAAAYYILQFAEAHPKEFPEADHRYLPVWREMLEIYAPGCLDLEFDEHLATNTDVERFLKLAGAARAALAEEGDTISGERLNLMVNAPELFEFQDRPKTKMLADFDSLLGVFGEV